MKNKKKSLLIWLAIVIVGLTIIFIATLAADAAKVELVDGYDWIEMNTVEQTNYIRGAVDVMNYLLPDDPIETDEDILFGITLLISNKYKESYPLSYTVIDIIMTF